LLDSPPGQPGKSDPPDKPDKPDKAGSSTHYNSKKEYGSMLNMSCLNGTRNLLKQRSVKTADECRDLCDANADCTTYEVNGPEITTCYLSKEIRDIETCCKPHKTHQLYPWTGRPEADVQCVSSQQ
jgi:hypothetical protein